MSLITIDYRDRKLIYEQLVDNIKELILQTMLIGHILNIVNKQNIRRAELILERLNRLIGIFLPLRHIGIHQIFTRRIEHTQIRIMLTGHIANCMQQVRLTHTCRTIQEKRIGMIGIIAWMLRHILCHSQWKLITRPHHKRIKGKML